MIISADAVIFSILAVRYIVTSAQESPTIYFSSVVLFCIFFYVLVDYLFIKKQNSFFYKAKLYTFLAVTFLLIYVPAGFIIFDTHVNNNQNYTSDGAILSEKAAKTFLRGKNPYEENFSDVLSNWPYQAGEIKVNPTIDHFPYLPMYAIINSVAFVLTNPLFGFFDIRFVSLIFLSLTILLIFRTKNEKSDKFLFSILILFNPVFLPTFLWGLNDIYVFLPVLLTVHFLNQRKIGLAMISLAL